MYGDRKFINGIRRRGVVTTDDLERLIDIADLHTPRGEKNRYPPGICPKCGERPKTSTGYCKECHAEYMREWRKSNPLNDEQRKRDICRSYAGVYKRRGKLVPGPCAVCGKTEDVRMKHLDYDKPLNVIWLCERHHRNYGK